jgi:hypothetical protein
LCLPRGTSGMARGAFVLISWLPVCTSKTITRLRPPARPSSCL